MNAHIANRIARQSSFPPQGARFLGVFAALLILLILIAPRATAQPAADSPFYWQYSASGRLQHVVTTDIDNNGVVDFLLADENGRIERIDAAGTRQWSFTAPGSVESLAVFNVDGSDDPTLEIVVGLTNEVILLNADGSQRWQARINPLTTPPSMLTSGGQEQELQWLRGYDFLPSSIVPYDVENDGTLEALLLLRSGQLLAFDGQGEAVWRNTDYQHAVTNTRPRLLAADLDGDGRSEIALGIFGSRRFSELILLDEGIEAWRLPLSGRLTGMVDVQFLPGGDRSLAIGTSLGQLYLYNAERERIWFRTLNKPISSLITAPLNGETVLMTGTSAGSVVGFDFEGRRIFSSNVSRRANQRIVALSASTLEPEPDQPSLVAQLESEDGNAASADTLLLRADGSVFSRVSKTDALGLTQLVDSNRDRRNELLTARFATLELSGLGIGDSENVLEWEYVLQAAPTVSLSLDLDGDDEDELIIGTDDGRIHSLDSDGDIRWLHDVGGNITHLVAMPNVSDGQAGIVIARNIPPISSIATGTSWVELREARGERVWEVPLEAPVTAVIVGEISDAPGQEIIVGTEDGQVAAFSAGGDRLWKHTLTGTDNRVQFLLVRDRTSFHNTEVIAAGKKHIYAIEPLGDDTFNVYNIANYEEDLIGLYPVEQPGNEELRISLLALVSDGTVHGMNWRGNEMALWPWPQKLGSIPLLSLPAGQLLTNAFQDSRSSFLLATNTGELMRLDIENNQPMFPWRLSDFGDIGSVYWSDRGSQTQPDMVAVGNEAGNVWLFTRANTPEPQAAFEPLELSSGVFDMAILNRQLSQTPDLLVVTDNGLVQLYREQENRPPLVTNPRVEMEQDQYSISVTVRDVENDDVTVQLQIRDPETGDWLGYETQRLANGNGTLFWPIVSPPENPNGLEYRLVYSDSFYQGTVQPEPGPPVTVRSPLDSMLPNVLLMLGGIGLLVGLLYLRQSQTPDARARRFYRQLRQRPSLVLIALEHKYAQFNGSPDFLLYLANQARQADDQVVANLADGLFLLPERPQAGLSIITRTLDEMTDLEPHWENFERWHMIYSTGQALLNAPTITELSLLRPQLLHVLNWLESQGKPSPDLALLQPIITSLRDSERVTLTDDRLVYLTEAGIQLQQALDQLPDEPQTIERLLAVTILRRWSGLVSAELEDLRGRAELEVTLKTQRLAPSPQTDIVLEISNHGRSAAENITVILDRNPAYRVNGPPVIIAIIPPGRTREARFTIEPRVIDRFRLSLTLTYDDRSQSGKVAAFADMVHLLPPVRDFQPIVNPYMPGTPLRRDSMLFYGREELFEFIAANSGDKARRNVLILVGQRRTGKTSALLRLEEHLPPHLLPVYVDCQSLGVTPGMPALLQEFAWYIADALAARDIDVNVPELTEWQKDPTHLFQRVFLAQVKALLPPESIILLVFDEFEAFENLVEDGILPRTFFTYLRHLMQHEDQLSFIFVGTQRLEQMTTDYWSVLFNIALYRKIDYLSTAAATRLITEPVAPGIVYDDLALDKILRVTAGHPYFLQLVCYTLVKRANTQRTGYVTISDVNSALDEMLSLGEVHFAYLWQRSSQTERALLTAVAHLMDRNLPFHPEELQQYLEPYDIHLGPTAVTSALNQLVQREIMREVTEEAKTLYELKVGLVGLWVAKNKSLTKLYADGGANGSGSSRQEAALNRS